VEEVEVNTTLSWADCDIFTPLFKVSGTRQMKPWAHRARAGESRSAQSLRSSSERGPGPLATAGVPRSRPRWPRPAPSPSTPSRSPGPQTPSGQGGDSGEQPAHPSKATLEKNAGQEDRPVPRSGSSASVATPGPGPLRRGRGRSQPAGEKRT
jgi:hypothetical protein